jgi:hypothetical protein
MNLKTFAIRTKQDCFFGNYQQNHKGEKCAMGKTSKERLTVLLCGNMMGEMEKLLMIGKAAKPRCCKNLKINNLPVIWRNNKKAWTYAATREEWLNMFNAKMKKENKCHPFS